MSFNTKPSSKRLRLRKLSSYATQHCLPRSFDSYKAMSPRSVSSERFFACSGYSAYPIEIVNVCFIPSCQKTRSVDVKSLSFSATESLVVFCKIILNCYYLAAGRSTQLMEHPASIKSWTQYQQPAPFSSVPSASPTPMLP